MADIRIKDLATTATTTASDDFMAVDGATNGTRKLSAATPAFLTSVTTPSLTAPASTNLTLAGGTAGSDSVVVSNTLAASSAIIGAFKVGNGTAATNVAIGGGNINAGGTGTFGGLLTLNSTSTVNGSMTFNGGARIIADGGTAAATGIGFTANTGIYYTGSHVLRFSSNGTEAFNVSASAATFAGAVTVSSSTAGSANAGALVLTGGLSAGNNSNASYFGGAVTVNAISGINALAAGTQLATFESSVNGAAVELITKGKNSGGTARQANTGINRFADDVWSLSNGTTEHLRVSLTTGAATFAGTVIAPAATASLAPLRIPHGTAPTSPTNGDMWSTTAGLFIRINGVTKTVTLT